MNTISKYNIKFLDETFFFIKLFTMLPTSINLSNIAFMNCEQTFLNVLLSNRYNRYKYQTHCDLN